MIFESMQLNKVIRPVFISCVCRAAEESSIISSKRSSVGNFTLDGKISPAIKLIKSSQGDKQKNKYFASVFKYIFKVYVLYRVSLYLMTFFYFYSPKLVHKYLSFIFLKFGIVPYLCLFKIQILLKVTYN